jgi:hypothetical protein
VFCAVCYEMARPFGQASGGAAQKPYALHAFPVLFAAQETEAEQQRLPSPQLIAFMHLLVRCAPSTMYMSPLRNCFYVDAEPSGSKEVPNECPLHSVVHSEGVIRTKCLNAIAEEVPVGTTSVNMQTRRSRPILAQLSYSRLCRRPSRF